MSPISLSTQKVWVILIVACQSPIREHRSHQRIKLCTCPKLSSEHIESTPSLSPHHLKAADHCGCVEEDTLRSHFCFAEKIGWPLLNVETPPFLNINTEPVRTGRCSGGPANHCRSNVLILVQHDLSEAWNHARAAESQKLASLVLRAMICSCRSPTPRSTQILLSEGKRAEKLRFSLNFEPVHRVPIKQSGMTRGWDTGCIVCKALAHNQEIRKPSSWFRTKTFQSAYIVPTSVIGWGDEIARADTWSTESESSN